MNKGQPILAAYYRSWRDKFSDSANPNYFSDLPPAVDIAIIFPNDEVQPTFWAHLPAEVDTLIAKGTTVLRTLFVDALLQPHFQLAEDAAPLLPFTENDAGYAARAQEILTRYAALPGITGLVIDVDHPLSASEVHRAAGVWRALAARLHDQKAGGGMLVFDHDILTDFSPLFPAVAPFTDYVFVDCYGLSLADVERRWADYAPYIAPQQFIPGFSFYEERGEYWHDISGQLAGSHAADLIKWQPMGGTKGGLFAYAADRDGITEGNDTLQYTDFNQLKSVKSLLLQNTQQ